MSEHWPPGPTRRELKAIEAEWPLIEAEMAVTDAEAVIALHGQSVSERAWARRRLAEARLSNVNRDWFNLGGPMDGAA